MTEDPPKEKDLEAQLSELEEELIEKLHEIDENAATKSEESILSDEFGRILYLPQLLRPIEEHSSKLILDEHKYYKYKPETVPKADPTAPEPLLKKLSSEEIIAKTHEFQRQRRRISNISDLSVPSIEKEYEDNEEFQPFLHNDYSKLEHLEKKIEEVLKFNIITDLIKEIEETIEEAVSVEEAEDIEPKEEESETVAEESKKEEEEQPKFVEEPIAESIVEEPKIEEELKIAEEVVQESEAEPIVEAPIIEEEPEMAKEEVQEPEPKSIVEEPIIEEEPEIAKELIEETKAEPILKEQIVKEPEITKEVVVKIKAEPMIDEPKITEKTKIFKEVVEETKVVPIIKELEIEEPKIEKKALEEPKIKPILEKPKMKKKPLKQPKKLQKQLSDIPKPKPKVPRSNVHLAARKSSEQLVIDGYIIKKPKLKEAKSPKIIKKELPTKARELVEFEDEGRFLFKRESDSWSSQDVLKNVRDSINLGRDINIESEIDKKKSIILEKKEPDILQTAGSNDSGMKPVRTTEKLRILRTKFKEEDEKEKKEETEKEEEKKEEEDEKKEEKEEPEKVELTRKEKTVCLCPKKETQPKSCICPQKNCPQKKSQPKKLVCFCTPEKLNNFTSTTELHKMVPLVKNPIEDCFCGFSVNCTPINTQDLKDSCLCQKPFTEKFLSKFGIKRYPRKEIVDPPPFVRHLEEALGIACPRVQIKHYPPLGSCSDQSICERILGTIRQLSSSNSSVRNCRYNQLRIHLEPPFGCQCNIEAFSFTSSNGFNSKRTHSPDKIKSNSTQTNDDDRQAYFLTADDISVCMNDEVRSYLGNNVKVNKAVVRFIKGRPRIAVQISLNDSFNESAWCSIDAKNIGNQESNETERNSEQPSEKLIHLHKDETKAPRHSIVDPVFMNKFKTMMEQIDDDDSDDISLKIKTAVPDLNLKLKAESLPLSTRSKKSENLIGNFPITCKPTEKFTLSVCTDKATTTSRCVKIIPCTKKFLKPTTYQQGPKRVKNESCVCKNLPRNELEKAGNLINLKEPCKKPQSILCSKFPSCLPSGPILDQRDSNRSEPPRQIDILCPFKKSDTSIFAPKCLQKLSKCMNMNYSENKPTTEFKKINQVDNFDQTIQNSKKENEKDHEDVNKKEEKDDVPVQKNDNGRPKRSSLSNHSDERNTESSMVSLKSVHFDKSSVRDTKDVSPENDEVQEITNDTPTTDAAKTENLSSKVLENAENFFIRVDASSGHIFLHKTSEDSIDSKDVAVGDLDSLLAFNKTALNAVKAEKNSKNLNENESFVLCDNCGGYKSAGISICTQDDAGNSKYCKKLDDDVKDEKDENEIVTVDKSHLKALDQQLHQLLNSSIKCRCGCDFDIPYRNFVAARGLLDNGKKSRLSRCFNAIKSIFK